MCCMDNFIIYVMYSVVEAMENLGIDVEKINVDCVGVIWGFGIGGLVILEKEIEDYIMGNGIFCYNFFMIFKMIFDIVVGLIFIRYGFWGVNFVIVFVCVFFFM